MDRLLNGMGKGFETLPMAFSASTSANQTQDILDAKMDKRRKGVFGPTVAPACLLRPLLLLQSSRLSCPRCEDKSVSKG